MNHMAIPALNICENCTPGSKGNLWPGTCTAVKDDVYTKYWVQNMGVNGSTAMKQEIFSRGPISCSIEATSNLMNIQEDFLTKFTKYNI